MTVGVRYRTICCLELIFTDLNVLHTKIDITLQHRQIAILMIPLESFHKQESYEKNPEDFNQEIDDVSDMADKYDISCIYDNHQWECSSYLGYGIGFPNSILSQAFLRNHRSEEQTSELQSH